MGSSARSVGAGQWCGCELWDDDARRDDTSWGGLLGNIPHPVLFRRLCRVLSVLLRQLPPHVCVKALLPFPLRCTVARAYSLLRWCASPTQRRRGVAVTVTPPGGLPGVNAACGRQVRATTKRFGALPLFRFCSLGRPAANSRSRGPGEQGGYGSCP